MTVKRHHLVALYLGWIGAALVNLGAHLFDVTGWLVTAAIAFTGFAVTLAAMRWPIGEDT